MNTIKKELETLFYKDINSSILRTFVDKKGSSDKEYNLIKTKESMIEKGPYTVEEKKNMKDNLMIKHYISLLEEGFEYTQILDEINNIIRITKLKNDGSYSALQLEKEYLDKANTLISQLDSIDIKSNNEYDLTDIEQEKTPKR